MIKVKFLKLWEICDFDRNFSGVPKSKQPRTLDYKHVSANVLKNYELDNNGTVELLSTGLFNGRILFDENNDFINEGEVISIPSGGEANMKYYKGLFIDSGNILLSSKNNDLVLTKFIYYYLLTIKESIQIKFRGGGVQHPAMQDIIEFEIPIPPLEVQKEIVEILDKFTTLEAELEAELEARRRQYGYYRESLLNFNNHIPRVPLWQVTNWDKKFIGISKDKQEKVIKYKYLLANQIKDMENEQGDIFILSTGNYRGWTTRELAGEYLAKGEVVSIPWGGTAVVKYFKGEFVTSDNRIATSKDINILDNKFLYYVLKNSEPTLESFYRGPNIKHPSMEKVLNFEIPLPPIDVQRKIVAQLDKFSELVEDIEKGLPKEIDLRRKQYEYYRNKLLTFEGQ